MNWFTLSLLLEIEFPRPSLGRCDASNGLWPAAIGYMEHQISIDPGFFNTAVGVHPFHPLMLTAAKSFLKVLMKSYRLKHTWESDGRRYVNQNTTKNSPSNIL